MKMNKEITYQPENERKYLMRRLPNIEWDDVYFIEQFYVPGDDNKQKRVRFTYDLHGNGSFGTLRGIECIFKETVGPGQNIEHHYPVNRDEADAMKQNATRSISKTRHIYKLGDFKFEVDVFVGMSLVMMEIELPNIDDEIIFPIEIGKEIITEATFIDGNPFSNFKLANSIKK